MGLGKGQAKCSLVWVFVRTHTHERLGECVGVCVSEGAQVWVGGSGGILRLGRNRVQDGEPTRLSSSLPLSLSSRPTEKAADDCFLAFFFSPPFFFSSFFPPRLEFSPAANISPLPTVLFEHLQQGNISTAFQAQACLWLCLSSTRHSAVGLHRQAPHSMLQRQNINIVLVANKNKSICIKSLYHSRRYKYKKNPTMAMKGFPSTSLGRLDPRIFSFFPTGRETKRL